MSSTATGPAPLPSAPKLPGVSRRELLTTAFLPLLWLANGCAYSLGPTNQQVAGASTIAIDYFPNETLQPRLADMVANAVRKEVQRDGTFRLVSRGDADITVSGRITAYTRTPVGSRRDDVLTPTDYDIKITVQAKAMRAGQVVYEGVVSGNAMVAFANDLNNAERENTPVAAANLARNLVGAIANGSW